MSVNVTIFRKGLLRKGLLRKGLLRKGLLRKGLQPPKIIFFYTIYESIILEYLGR